MTAVRITRVTFTEPAYLPGSRTPVHQLLPETQNVLVQEDAVGIMVRSPTGHAERVPWHNIRSVSYSPGVVIDGPLADAEPAKAAPKSKAAAA